MPLCVPRWLCKASTTRIGCDFQSQLVPGRYSASASRQQTLVREMLQKLRVRYISDASVREGTRVARLSNDVGVGIAPWLHALHKDRGQVFRKPGGYCLALTPLSMSALNSSTVSGWFTCTCMQHLTWKDMGTTQVMMFSCSDESQVFHRRRFDQGRQHDANQNSYFRNPCRSDAGSIHCISKFN